METASFGEWVRRRRMGLDLTQAELAARVACAPITIRKIEADERRPSKVMAERIADALSLDGDSRDRFVAAARAVSSPVRMGSPVVAATFGPSGDLPVPLHPLLGREVEVADLIDLLHVSGGPARLVTLVGPPGVGKTRLAIEVASRAERKFDVPAVFVDLSLVSDPADVPARIADAVSTPAAALVDAMTLAVHALRRNPALVVLDNFEHVLGAADQVQRLVESCPDVVCLVTSRAPLDLYGEQLFPLEPLAVDGDAGPDAAEQVAGGGEALPPAVRLFVDRAREVDRRFDAAAHAGEVAEICRLVDGLPLAIELAARRVRDLTPAALVDELGADGSALGTVPRGRAERQRSADGAIAWSFGLLTPAAQEVLLRASVFAGAFDAAGVAALADDPGSGGGEDVPGAGPVGVDGSAGSDGTDANGGVDATGGADGGVAGALDELAAHALVRSGARPDGGLRSHDMLMVVREFGRHRLDQQGRLGALRSRHARLIATRLEAVSPGIEAWPERDVIDALVMLDPDVRAALAWTFGPGDDPATGRRLAAGVLTLWYFRGQVADSVRWSEIAYRSLDPERHGFERYQAAYYLAASLWSAGELEPAAGCIDEAIAGAEAAGDAKWLAETVGMKQMLALSAGDIVAAAALAPRCVATAERAGGEWLLMAHLRAARLALFSGDLTAADQHVEALTRLCVEVAPSTWGRSNGAGASGDVRLAHGDTESAIDSYLRAVEGFLSMEAPVYAIARVSSVANALVVAGDAPRAARLYGLVDAWCDDLGAPLHPMAAFAHAHHRGLAEEQLGDRFEALAAEGRYLSRSVESLRSVLAAEQPGVRGAW